MDYDKSDIPDTYDQARAYAPDVLAMWLEKIESHVGADGIADIVDLGSGTGRYSHALAEHFAARVVGVEPSAKMRRQAESKETGAAVTFKEGSGEALPIDDASADMVFMSMVFHHLTDPRRTAAECLRVLRPGGHVVVRNGTTEEFHSYHYGDFFAGAREAVERRLVSRQFITQVFQGAGLDRVAHEIVVHPMAPDWRAYAEKLAKRADSVLASLPDDVFHAGITALRTHAEHTDDKGPVTANVDFFVLRRMG